MAILVTGGSGYIGSHTVLTLLNDGKDVIVIDSLINSSPEALKRVEDITGKNIIFYEGDVCDKSFLTKIFLENKIDSVIHFAGLKSVSDSIRYPLKYYNSNVVGTITLLNMMLAHNVKSFIFSSSATVYGEPEHIPLDEGCSTGGTKNPYGTSKYISELVLRDLCNSDDELSIIVLRYFNPVGSHPSGLLGEDPRDIPNNLVPYISQVAAGKLSELLVYGGDYPTVDGTGVRDYIHVMDLAEGHLHALNINNETKGLRTYNLGTGKGYSVLEMIRAFEKASGRKIPYKITSRRDGDVAECWSDPSLAQTELNWRAIRGLEEMMYDTWRWQKNNPNGYSN
ncbi:UDP-glucose 4-epimerase GalE [Pectobacterium polaris]|uniref:UDP-glucose 4-epimerase GalE n=1 Tax=Pectobacterium polaris TaxID=2042057 RepID=UPI0021C5C8B2|nr:UDP-glucose 4-epimerase GalE [Pectobacterium polaris]MCU1792650.1 UDP-glucose 4-epimerase GalE [Pectobacterium polaris]